MSMLTRASLSKNTKDSNILLDDGSVNSNEDDIGFQAYYHEQIVKENIDDCPENEMKYRDRWNNFRLSRKKSFIKIKCALSIERKRSYSQQSSVESTCASSPNDYKKMKMDINENCSEAISIPHQEVEDLYQLEVQRLIASPAYYNFQPVCNVCEIFTDNLDVIRCTGVCLRHFHRNCLVYPEENPLPADTNFQCVDCWTNTYKCFICTKTDKILMLIHCEVSDCGRLYHKHCLENSNYPYVDVTEDSVKSCPAHHCVTCAREDCSSIDTPCTKLFQCIRCPISFHDADLCTAAGSVELSLSHVICPRHFENTLIKSSHFKPYHPDWCFKCFKPDQKLRCHYCPSSYHVNCVGKSKRHTEKENIFLCKDCRYYRQPRYGEIVFVKVSMYRWWPCEIIHPRNAPMNVLKLKRPDGTFPILFLGSHEYQWATRSRTIYYNMALKSSIVHDPLTKSKIGHDFTTGLEQAATMHRIFVNLVLKHVPLKSITAESMTRKELMPYMEFKDDERKTIKYRLIKDNVLVAPAELPLAIEQLVCDCTESCELFQCRNYVRRVECRPDSCPCNDRCHNRLFTTHCNKNLGVTKTNNCGFGLRTTKILTKNEFIIEYVGEIITRSTSIARISQARKSHIRDFYMMQLHADLVIDAAPKGNLSRFMNHSCNPNCRVERWTVNGQLRLGVFADCDIDVGAELTFDYRSNGFIMDEDMFCLCNGQSCSGFLGPDKARTVAVSPVMVMARRSSGQESPNKQPEERVDLTEDDHVDPDTDNTHIDLLSDEDLQNIGQITNSETEIVSQEKEQSEKKIDPVKEYLSKLVPIKALEAKTSPNSFLSTDTRILAPLPLQPSAKGPKNGRKLVSIRAKKPAPTHIEKMNQTEFVDLSLRPTQLQRQGDPFEEYLKKIDHLKESQRKSAIGPEILRKIEPRRDTATKLVPFEEYVKKIEHLKGTQKRPEVPTDSKRTMVLRQSSVSRPMDLLSTSVPSEEVSVTEPLVSVVQSNEELHAESLFPDSADIDNTIIEAIKEGQSEDPAVEGAVLQNDQGTHEIVVNQESITKDNAINESTNDKVIREIVVNPESITKENAINEPINDEVIREIVSNPEFITEDIASNESINEEACRVDSAIPESIMEDNTTNNEEVTKDDLPCDEPIADRESPRKDVHNGDSNTISLVDNLISPFTDISQRKDIVYEIYCFRCFDGGELVLCDKPGCTKTYHLSCIGLEKAPLGTWYCPWHFCDMCGEPSHLFCAQCPVSFCREHCDHENILAPVSAQSHLSLCHFHRGWRKEDRCGAAVADEH